MPSIADIKLIIVGQVKCETCAEWTAIGVTVWRCVSPDGIVHELCEYEGNRFARIYKWLGSDGQRVGFPYESMEDACIAAFGAWAA